MELKIWKRANNANNVDSLSLPEKQQQKKRQCSLQEAIPTASSAVLLNRFLLQGEQNQ